MGPVVGDKPLYVYYCKYSGKHALTTDCNLAAAPRRRTDHAIVLDTQAHLAKLYTSDGGTKLLRRRWGPRHMGIPAGNPRVKKMGPWETWQLAGQGSGWQRHAACPTLCRLPPKRARLSCSACRNGTVERQIRLNAGKLPVAYRTEPEGR